MSIIEVRLPGLKAPVSSLSFLMDVSVLQSIR